MSSKTTGATELELLGGRLCLDFVNTVDWRTGEAPVECLTSYDELVGWGRHAGTLSDGEARRLGREAAGRPRAAAETLRRAVELREGLYSIFRAAVEERSPAPGDLAMLNRALATVPAAVQLAHGDDGFSWRASGRSGTLDSVLAPIAWSGAELLASPDLARLKQCGAGGCGWLFLDLSRGRSRRWCAMASCGNRAKARRHYARRRGRRD